MVTKISILAFAFIQVAFGQTFYQAPAAVVGSSAGIGSGLASFGSGLANYGTGLANYGSGLVGLGSSALGSGLTVGGGALGLAGLSGPFVPSPNGVQSTLYVTSVSPIPPSGLAVASENTIEGVMSVSGQLPWLSAVAVEGSVPTSGSGVATCGCGNGQVGITSQGLQGQAISSFPYSVGAGNIYL